MMGLTLYAGVVLISLMGSAIVGPMWTNGSGHPPLLERCHFVLDTGHHFYGQQRVPFYEYDFSRNLSQCTGICDYLQYVWHVLQVLGHFAKPFFL